jgi:hypothetical protein
MRFFFIMATLAIATLVGCTKPIQQAKTNMIKPPPSSTKVRPQEFPISGETSVPVPENRFPSIVTPLPSRSAIVRSASRLVGARAITSQGKRIAYDCAGVTRAIFLEHGIDLYRSDINDLKGNGVRLIHNHVRRHGVLHQGPEVHPGDLVFFDNTWDFNGDGRLNDPLTHVGVVERLEANGTVVFISRVADAIERYRMNLDQPHVHKTAQGLVLNDYIRRKLPTDPDHAAHLTGELFSYYGNLLSPHKHTSSEGTLIQDSTERRASVSVSSELPEQ